ncbi:class I SAM-dependent methyltransferase [Halanaerobium salsuginis]|jgi:ubiquinone/menaquinone biosynthesis C-methylase UbiE|uniref:Methyltransferase domain-containing protein n=1 Tax=Halanaerobium salsuginis TaxID=29563 RepID=A0A1I4JX91_9FIRM|nr:methyltransferase domain-containing protein [Halanaerobium salsuginis]SFL70847.1 Methyltransferase domain-containing protein [Halanaerobium salsuginis]
MTDHKFNPAKRAKLLAKSRLEILQPFNLLKRFNLQAGDIFIDVGAGNGAFAIPAAKIVGRTGFVYAVDVEIKMLLDLKYRAQQLDLSNRIEIIKSQENDANLRQPADLMLFSYMLHEVDNKFIFLENYFRFLKTGARVIFIEWQADVDDKAGPPASHRVARSELKELLKDNNITDLETEELSSEIYLMTGLKK